MRGLRDVNVFETLKRALVFYKLGISLTDDNDIPRHQSEVMTDLSNELRELGSSTETVIEYYVGKNEGQRRRRKQRAIFS